MRKTDRAIASYRRAVDLRPNYPTAWFNLGCIYHRIDDKDQAIECYRRAVEHDARYLKAILSLGTVLQKEKRSKEALEVLSRAVEYFPNHSKLLRRLGLVLFDLGDLQGASERLRLAKDLDPRDADNWHSLAGVELIQGNNLEARRLFDGALALKPDHEESLMGKSILELAEGNYKAGWPGYELRLRRNPVNKQLSSFPRWDGSPLNGRTLLVHAEQGIGDTIQFIRYLDRLRSENGTYSHIGPRSSYSIIASIWN